jgi:hypothetical protein
MSLWKHLISSTHPRALGTGLAAAACLSMGVAVGVGAAATADPRAHAAHLVSVNDTAYLRTADPNSTSSTIVEEGKTTGTLPGTVRARLAVGVSTVNVGFTIYLHGGSISGQAKAKLNPGSGEYASFKGALEVAHGSGKYAHAKGIGNVYGSLNHYSYEAKVQVIGQLRY